MGDSRLNFDKVTKVVYQAGKNLKKHFGNIPEVRYKSNCEADIVTQLDEDTELYIENELKKLDPTIGFKGEEFGSGKLGDRFWLADPIDGTGLFTRGISGCTVMLALIEEGDITFSTIYDFISDKLYTAEKGKGAFLNKKRIKVSNRGLSKAFLHVECNLENEGNSEIFHKLHGKCILLSSYPAGIHFALTAEGKIEGRICFDPYGKDYDFAAGQLLVSEAGGVVKNIGKETFNYQDLNFLAVTKEVYEDLTVGEGAIFPVSKTTP